MPVRSCQLVAQHLRLPYTSVRRFLIDFEARGHRLSMEHNRGRPTKIS